MSLRAGGIVASKDSLMPAHVRQNYNGAHKRTRKAWAPLVATGQVNCWRCNKPIEQGSRWDVGHVPNAASRPEHMTCNRSAGAIEGNRKRRPSSRYFG